MKPHPRIRKTIKWGGAAVTVLLVVVWVGSGWWFVGWTSRLGLMIGAIGGRGIIGFDPSLSQRQEGAGWHLNRVGVPDPEGDVPFTFWFYGYRNPAYGDWMVFIPLWIPALLVFGATASPLYLNTLARRRARLNLCPKCHYDRTGLAIGAVCPECGSASLS